MTLFYCGGQGGEGEFLCPGVAHQLQWLFLAGLAHKLNNRVGRFPKRVKVSKNFNSFFGKNVSDLYALIQYASKKLR